MATMRPLQRVTPAKPSATASQSTPKATAAPLLTINAADKQGLADIHELLSRLFIRHRNQHRQSHWFRHLSTFRKQLGLLLAEMENVKKGNVAEKLEKRLQFWDANCVHDWYLTFTQLVAANQFAMIGLVLMAAVARVCKSTGITDLYEEIGSEHMQIVLKTVNNGTLVEEFGSLKAEGQCDDDEDLGEVIERDE